MAGWDNDPYHDPVYGRDHLLSAQQDIRDAFPLFCHTYFSLAEKNKKLKFSNSFKLSTFAITPAVLFYVLLESVRYIMLSLDTYGNFIFRVPTFLTPIIFTMYIIAIFKVGKIPMQDMNENSDKI